MISLEIGREARIKDSDQNLNQYTPEEGWWAQRPKHFDKNRDVDNGSNKDFVNKKQNL